MKSEAFSNNLQTVLKSTRKRFDFQNMGYLPRWAILCIDTTIIVIALIIAKVIICNLQNDSICNFSPTVGEVIMAFVTIVFFILFRTYAGLIRHSTYIDAIKFFLALSSTSLVLLVTSYFSKIIGDTNLFRVPHILVYAVLSFSGLFLFRLIVKQVFDVYIRTKNEIEVTRVLVYGTSENAIAVASAIRSETPKRFKVLGFIDSKKQNSSKEIIGLPIYSSKRSPAVLLKFYKAQALILADNRLNKEENLAIVDNCINYNFKVYRAPLLSDVQDKNLLTKSIKKIQIEDILEREPIKLDNKLIAKELFNKCILVTGGAGSIGSEIVRQVANYKPKLLLILDQAESPLHNISLEIKQLFPDITCVPVITDVRNRELLQEVFKAYKPDIVYHAAAYKHVPLMEMHPSQAIFSNVIGTKNVADLALENNAEKFVMVSTDKAVNPSNVMGGSKRIAEIYVQSLQKNIQDKRNKNTQFVTTRFGNVLGSNGSVVPLFKRQIEEGGPLTITHPDIIRYFMTIPEACQLVLEAGAMGNGGEVFIFDMGKAVKIIDLATKIIKLAGFAPYKDIDIKVVGLRPGEKLYEELLTDGSETLPTYHNKIMIAKVQTYDFEDVKKQISILENFANIGDKYDIVKQMKVIVPEFISMNSDFESIDLKKA